MLEIFQKINRNDYRLIVGPMTGKEGLLLARIQFRAEKFDRNVDLGLVVTRVP